MVNEGKIKIKEQIESELTNFIEANHELVKKYHKNDIERCLHNIDDPKDKLKVLFINALNSGGGGQLEDKNKSLSEFEEFVNVLKEKDRKLSLEEFAKEIKNFKKEGSENDHRITILQKNLRKFKLMGGNGKRVNQFLRDVIYIKGKYFFSDINEIEGVDKELEIPVDSVIIRIFEKLLNKELGYSYTNAINKYAEKIFPNEPIFLEDLWFWGTFTEPPPPKKLTKKEKKKMEEEGRTEEQIKEYEEKKGKERLNKPYGLNKERFNLDTNLLAFRDEDRKKIKKECENGKFLEIMNNQTKN